jgi:hypothetical protein
MEWIKCSDRMPDYGIYLCCDYNEWVGILNINDGQQFISEKGTKAYPSHWMPLPAPPKQ